MLARSIEKYENRPTRYLHREIRRGPWEQLDSVRLPWGNTRSPLGRKNTNTMSVQSHLVRRPCLPPDSTAVHRRKRHLVHCGAGDPWAFFQFVDWTRGLLGCQVRNWLEVQGSFGVIKESIFGFLVLWRCNSVGLTGPCLI